ncbi:hypothetical protein [Streptomyces phaeochromogenes]
MDDLAWHQQFLAVEGEDAFRVDVERFLARIPISPIESSEPIRPTPYSDMKAM